MSKIKNLFSTPKKAVITTVCIFAVLILIIGGAVLISKAIAKGSSISQTAAENFAFADAGVSRDSAVLSHTEFDYDDGQFVYEVEFYYDGIEYDYVIKASDGTIINKKTEYNNAPISQGGSSSTEPSSNTVQQDNTAETSSNTAAQNNTAETSSNTISQNNTSNNYIGVDAAKEAALSHSGFKASEVTFYKAKLENDDGYTVYEIEFFKDNMEYEYSIDAFSGKILEYDMDIID